MQNVIWVIGERQNLQTGSHSELEEARLLGELLAKAGFSVLVENCTGLLAAVCEGVTSVKGKLWRIEDEAHILTGKEKGSSTNASFDKLLKMINNNVGIVVLPGGIVSLSYLSTAWALMQASEVERHPLILIGERWRTFIQSFSQFGFVEDHDFRMLFFANSVHEATDYLAEQLGHISSMKP